MADSADHIDVEDDDASQSSCVTFSSNESDGEDWDEYHDNRDMTSAAIERNSSHLQKLTVYPYNPVPTPGELISLGQNIGRNTIMKRLKICTDGVEEDDEIYSTENLEDFVIGIAKNRSIHRFWLEEYPFDRARLELLHPLIVENHNLTNLLLGGCNLSVHGIQMLANAFGRRENPSSMKHIVLYGNEINDEMVPVIVELANQCPQLKKLELGFSKIGDGCRDFASILDYPQSKLKCFYLHRNPISDEGGLALANALRSNKTLRRLYLCDCRSITALTWNGFFNCVCDTSSIASTFQSNHTLERMWRYDDDRDIMGLSERLIFALEWNKESYKTVVARKKIFRFHLQGDFSLAPFVDIDMELLPNVLGWIGKGDYINAKDETMQQGRGSAFYRILRSFPDLCSYPSAERKMRLQLEAEVSVLKQQIEQLKLENNELRSSKRPMSD